MRQAKKRRQQIIHYSVGTGRLGLALQEEYMRHLEQVQQEIGFTYIRGHGLFHEDIGIYQERKTKNGSEPFYNFTYIDRIFDRFLEIKIKPFLELGFMPKALSSSDETVFYWQGNITPPKEMRQWCQLVDATIRHFIDRYGLLEVRTWPIEVWNEPNLANFWKDKDQQAYFELYHQTALCIKQIDSKLKVGGPAICGGSDHWVDDFLTYIKKHDVPLDFFTRHAYTSKPPQVTFDYYYQDLEPPQDMLNQLESVRNQIDQQGFSHLPFYITEFNTSYSPINPVHDTLVNASYLAGVLAKAPQYVDGFSYWTFSDVFEEFGVPKALFHGGFGMMAFHGIKKPTYHLYRFFRQLGETILAQDDNMLVTETEDGRIICLLWHYTDEKGEVAHLNKTVTLKEVQTDYFIQHERLTETAGNPWRTWQQLGRPRFPSKQQIDLIKKTDTPCIETEQIHEPSLSVTLSKNEVRLITIVPITDNTDSYPGLDDRLITSY